MNSIDLFSGCGGLSEGMKNAGFSVLAGIELDPDSVKTYRLNHPETQIFNRDIREITGDDITGITGEEIHLLAGCPPCQGFSSVRRLNKKRSKKDARNELLMEYLRLVEELQPYTIMLENVPGLENYYLFPEFLERLNELQYNVDYEIVKIHEYGIPQRRKRLVLIGSLLGELKVAKKKKTKTTVRDAIGKLESIIETTDPAHKVVSKHTERIQRMISLIPKNGGSRKDLPEEYELECHKKENVGFNDIYGRLSWDSTSVTITGGCLNPSKGRFLHPDEDRVITPREAALLQTFPKDYIFPVDSVSKTSIATQIGNALPPKFSEIQCKNIKKHLDFYLG